MATSGSTLWQLTRNELIAAAIRKLARYDKNATPDSVDYTNGAEALNAVIAELQAIGMPLWARNEYTFSLTAGQATYTIGVGQALNTPFPLKVSQAVLLDTADDTRLDMHIGSIYEYNRYPSINTSGSPVHFFYQPKINLGEIKIWPTPDTTAASRKTIKIVYQRPFEDFTASGETLDFPKEWHQTIIYKLAAALAPEFAVPLQDRQLLMQEAMQHQTTAESFGNDETSIYFSPERFGHWRS
jgi:hypothetical protein